MATDTADRVTIEESYSTASNTSDLTVDPNHRRAPCRSCGADDRFPGGRCRECARQYRQKNRDEINALKRGYWNREKERLNAERREDRKKNPDKYRVAQRRTYERHKDAILLRSKLYYHATKQERRRTQRAWYVANVEKHRKSGRAWVENNRERRREIARTYSYRRRQTERAGKLSPGIVAKLVKLQRGKCACCGRPLGSRFHLDHIVPLALGGENADDNVQLLRVKCNLQKGAKHPVEFMQQRGLLL